MESKTVYREVQKEIIEKKSRFIASVKPVKSEEDAVAFINQLKSKYWDATHNVYAYSVYGGSIQRYSDDGEPQGTAGIPTLQAIKNLELDDVVVVVTRYFGGILLGAGGLVRAYGKSAREGLLEAEIVTKRVCSKVQLSIDYTMLGKVQSAIVAQGNIIENTIYKDNVILEVLIQEEMIDCFKKDLADILSGQVDIILIGQKTITIDSSNKLLEVE